MVRVLNLLILVEISVVFGEVIVHLPDGKIRGITKVSARNRTFYTFLQIPYAEPPLGTLRFKNPQPVKKWNDILNATSDRSVCYQVMSNSDMETEDCLYLSVYTPVVPGSNASLAVMFYIHGGGFMNGNSLFNTVGPHYFMDYEVVIVTVHYRLGPFGFLSTGNTVIPGNYGLKDQAFALKWVKQNIKYFGGNPAEVTIFGQSSGAVSVGYHIISHQSASLFRGAIQQSGSVLSPHGYQRHAKNFAYALAQVLDPTFSTNNSSQELLNLLQNASAKDIDTVSQNFSQGPGSMILSEGSWFAPVIECQHENAFITDYMYSSVENGDINKVPIIVGIMSEEAVSQAADITTFKSTVAQYDNNITFLVQGDMHIEDQNIKTLAGEAIRNIYTDGMLQDNLGAAVRYFSDSFVSKSSIRQADLLSKHTNIYFYQFSYHGALGNNDVYVEGAGRVSHSEDMKYLWTTNEVVNIGEIETNDLRTMEKYLKLFTDFGKTLNPTPEVSSLLENITWPKVTSSKFSYLDIGETLNVKANPKKKTRMNVGFLYMIHGQLNHMIHTEDKFSGTSNKIK
ncbi:hypothetical protein NQ318_000111 [Aromia moschata]|uniref:Carboxylic ester hydrolase n=1 Tax=Aromia moschata TaxID=1265417 RepID=A0AAV8XP04_9CUCU|nr:hypothetical protein NQ318_000111 [Aromia moschata]